MIVGKGKPIKEILSKIESCSSILVVGCGECTTVCHVGGEKEVNILASQLEMVSKIKKRDLRIEKAMVERQCDGEFLEDLTEIIGGVDVVVTLGCGAGAQTLAALFPETPVVPGINTRFIGAHTEKFRWDEKCSGCGDCIIGDFGGFCPITRCTKSLLNGPCGGSQDGRCELDPDIECVWQLIIERLMGRDLLDQLMTIHEPKDWRTSRSGGPRHQIHGVE